MKRENVLLSEICVDEELQVRCETDHRTVGEYVEALERGDVFPPIDCVLDTDGRLWVWDGFHRFEAYEEQGVDEVAVRWQEGTREDAAWLAIGANGIHGLKRTNADKRRAVMKAIEHPKSAGMSDHEIAAHCGVSQPFVSSLRGESDNRYHFPPTSGEEVPEQEDVPIQDFDETENPDFEDGFKEDKDEPSPIQGIDGDVPRDALNHEIPPHALRQMRDVPRIETAKRRLADLNADLNALLKDQSPSLVFLEGSRIRSAIANIKSLLKQATPYAVCPKCEGRGCSTCRDAGWLNSDLYDIVSQS